MAVLLVLLATPALAFVAAFIRALILFFPTMIVLGIVHTYIPIVPSLGWLATFWVLVLVGLFVPTSSSSSDD